MCDVAVGETLHVCKRGNLLPLCLLWDLGRNSSPYDKAGKPATNQIQGEWDSNPRSVERHLKAAIDTSRRCTVLADTG